MGERELIAAVVLGPAFGAWLWWFFGWVSEHLPRDDD